MSSGTHDTGQITHAPGTETAVLAGGCFWGMEDLIRRQPGVLATCHFPRPNWVLPRRSAAST